MAEAQVRSGERRQRILQAGIAVFSRKGYRDTAVDEIAAKSETSKGGVYFHFPNKQAIFLALLEQMGSLLLRKVEEAMRGEPDPVPRGDVALLTVLKTFGEHRSLARLFLVEAMGAGREFNNAMLEQHTRCAGLIKRHLDDAVAQGAIPEIDTDIASLAWFGAVNEVTMRWLLTEQPRRLEEVYPTLRILLARSAGVPQP